MLLTGNILTLVDLTQSYMLSAIRYLLAVLLNPTRLVAKLASCRTLIQGHGG